MNEMRLIELVAEHEGNDTNGRLFNEHVGEVQIDDPERELLIKYLNEGCLLDGFMEWWFDCNNSEKSIGPAAYYTDGKWIWAEYHAYYFANYPNYKLDNNFITDVRMQKFMMPEVTESQKDIARKYLLSKTYPETD